eukprot:CAMPEP_0170289944 /NCGR_PEP_ID=MMETSP0116_2-20130129/45046_1 /TAXON_ID=400756 /ORGANISM="Durinskia baltica, Strain CSIRO CS-38" /LENGTH=101 /DNA_ID=CAMNT_0010541395 /DNA_START=1 /DNA_END=302 /DNA_ORIENTATION=-
MSCEVAYPGAIDVPLDQFSAIRMSSQAVKWETACLSWAVVWGTYTSAPRVQEEQAEECVLKSEPCCGKRRGGAHPKTVIGKRTDPPRAACTQDALATHGAT